ncbi:hypothetical protein NLG97_g10618 [Lecanicillium saksenae]|uniref:Uncharacterized protein n=1 Tax=Lecanicillium saksenae TaxID=468837 RepID=A0ACC1QED9_9HYPO|nr:hypothetical protein NLG97_g10618 [Lecanicillium saksenae]
MQLKHITFLAAVAAAAPGSSGAHRPGSPESIKNLKDKIKNVVIMVMENRSFDNIMGGQTLAGLENPIQTGPYCNPLNISHPDTGNGCTQALDFDSIIDDPDHSISGNNLEFYGSFTPDNAAIKAGTLQPDMSGFLTEQIRLYGGKQDEKVLQTQVINYYTESQVPVITALTQNFVVFNHWHSDIPGPTNPNRVALCSGTSAGKGKNNFKYNTMTQKSIFQQVTELGMEWKDYLVDTSIQDARWFKWTYQSNNTHRIVFMDSFYEDAKKGKLPHLSYINPSCCGDGTNSMHPTGRVSDGEQLIKDVYEALRASPQWNDTLWIITFDETGGFHDHVKPPTAVRPDYKTHDKETRAILEAMLTPRLWTLEYRMSALVEDRTGDVVGFVCFKRAAAEISFYERWISPTENIEHGAHFISAPFSLLVFLFFSSLCSTWAVKAQLGHERHGFGS